MEAHPEMLTWNFNFFEFKYFQYFCILYNENELDTISWYFLLK